MLVYMFASDDVSRQEFCHISVVGSVQF